MATVIRILLVVSLVGLGFLSQPESAYACSCDPDRNIDFDFNRARAVFAGRVTSAVIHRPFREREGRSFQGIRKWWSPNRRRSPLRAVRCSSLG